MDVVIFKTFHTWSAEVGNIDDVFSVFRFLVMYFRRHDDIDPYAARSGRIGDSNYLRNSLSDGQLDREYEVSIYWTWELDLAHWPLGDVAVIFTQG